MNTKLALAAVCSKPESKFYPVQWNDGAMVIGKERKRLSRRGCMMMEQPGLAVVFFNGQFCYATGTGTANKRAEFVRVLRMIADPTTRKIAMKGTK